MAALSGGLVSFGVSKQLVKVPSLFVVHDRWTKSAAKSHLESDSPFWPVKDVFVLVFSDNEQHKFSIGNHVYCIGIPIRYRNRGGESLPCSDNGDRFLTWDGGWIDSLWLRTKPRCGESAKSVRWSLSGVFEFYYYASRVLSINKDAALPETHISPQLALGSLFHDVRRSECDLSGASSLTTLPNNRAQSQDDGKRRYSLRPRYQYIEPFNFVVALSSLLLGLWLIARERGYCWWLDWAFLVMARVLSMIGRKYGQPRQNQNENQALVHGETLAQQNLHVSLLTLAHLACTAVLAKSSVTGAFSPQRCILNAE